MLETRESLLASVNVGVAFFLLASSSLFMDDWRRELADCNDYKDLIEEGGAQPPDDMCKTELFFVLGATFGIIASTIQMLSATLSFINKLNIWPYVQALCLILAILAFAIPVAEKANKLPTDYGNGSGRFFLSCTMIDTVFLLFAIPIMYHWTK